MHKLTDQSTIVIAIVKITLWVTSHLLLSDQMKLAFEGLISQINDGLIAF